MNALKIFSNDEFGEIRTVEIDGKIYFVGIDIARALGYSNPSKAVIQHCKGVTKLGIPSNGGKQETNCIPEGDLYRLITHSELPSAEHFENWVFDEVLPSIRKHGIYATDKVIDDILNNPDFGIELLTKLKEERAARLVAEKKNAILMHVNKTYTMTEIAKELGLKSAIELNKLLAEKKIQYKVNETWVMYSQYSDLGYEEIKQEVLDNGKVIYHRRITQMGREFILNLFDFVA
ncbi:phage antirepressor [Enterocloster clostridioformis]|uniref:Prophage antirepressor n=1 Tax=Enterocloster clostridioformis TaxID=1531 RepID=A0A1I0JNK8_9FIRM|nr:phage antirepressor KilAC domain-containing protein [Enterocloster clostridioformis]SEU12173.1 Prophage antirepressor [Enterocloster clostridioformis]SEW15708.1 Prophage antirepressor [Enterocloster clostridioformis]